MIIINKRKAREFEAVRRELQGAILEVYEIMADGDGPSVDKHLRRFKLHRDKASALLKKALS